MVLWWWHPPELLCEKVRRLNIVWRTTRKEMSFTQHRVKLPRHSPLGAPEKFSSDYRWGKISLGILCTCMVSRWSDPIGRCRHWCSLCCQSLNCLLGYLFRPAFPLPPNNKWKLAKNTFLKFTTRLKNWNIFPMYFLVFFLKTKISNSTLRAY